jgi:hypothetical protein
MFILFISVLCSFVSRSKSVDVYIVYICIDGGDPIINSESFWFPLISKTLPFCASPKLGLEFPSACIMFFFVFNDLRREAIIILVDLDVIVDHHCLNFHNLFFTKRTF